LVGIPGKWVELLREMFSKLSTVCHPLQLGEPSLADHRPASTILLFLADPNLQLICAVLPSGRALARCETA